MANDGFILLIEAIENDENRNDLRVTKRNLRDTSDPLTMPEQIFQGIYRLSRQLANDIIFELSPHLKESDRPEISIPKKLKILTALHFYAHGGYQKSIGQDFISAMSQSLVSNSIAEVTSAINENMHHVIRFPQTEVERNIEKQGFMNMPGGFPGIIGAIDCTHVAIVSPPVHDRQFPAIVFLNRKGYYSLNVQIICNAALKILAINARYPGSVHDSAIWQTSAIKQAVIRNYYDGDRSSWLLGDSGYPLEPWLITPITAANMDDAENRFNRAHKSIRNVIERLNGVLKTRFRCLLKHRVLHYGPVMAANIINACAILHNRCVERNEIDEEQMEVDGYRNHRNHLNQQNNWLNDGRNARNRIINTYFRI